MRDDYNMKRTPIITREPVSFSDLRKPILLDEPYKMYPIWKFEGVYNISITGIIQKTSTGDYLNLYNSRIGKVACLHHPDSDCGTLCANLSDIWSSTFLGDKALNFYSYMDSIKKK